MTQPAILLHPASDSRYRAYPRISLLTWWLTFSQVGLPRFREVTHWVTLLNFILRYAEIPTSWASLAQWDIVQISVHSKNKFIKMLLDITNQVKLSQHVVYK